MLPNYRIARYPLPGAPPPPPKYMDMDQNGATSSVTTARERGWTDDATPTNRASFPKPERVKSSLLPRFFLKAELEVVDVRAAYLPSLLSNPQDMDMQLAKAKAWQQEMGNMWFFTSGKKTSSEHLARLTMGFVGVHDARVRLTNIGILIQRYSIPVQDETDMQRQHRRRLAAGLRVSFVMYQYRLVDFFERAITEASPQAAIPRAFERLDDFADQNWIAMLTEYKREFDTWDWGPQVDHVDNLPSLCETYAEVYSPGTGKDPTDFWRPIFEKPGYAASFLYVFKDVFDLPRCLDPQQAPQFYQYALEVFCAACHWSHTMVTSKVYTQQLWTKRDLRTPAGSQPKLPVEPEDFFVHMRFCIQNMVRPTWDQIFVHANDPSQSMKRLQKNRGSPASADGRGKRPRHR